MRQSDCSMVNTEEILQELLAQLLELSTKETGFMERRFERKFRQAYTNKQHQQHHIILKHQKAYRNNS